MGTIAVLLLQFFRSSTRHSRMLFIGGLVLYVLAEFLPWTASFAIQQWFATDRSADRFVSIAFDPDQRGAAQEDSLHDQPLPKNAGNVGDLADSKSVWVPVQIMGLPLGSILHSDRIAIRLLDSDGRTIYRGTGKVFNIQAAEGEDGHALLRQSIQIPPATYEKFAEQTFRLELNYSLTLLQPHPLPPLSAPAAAQSVAELGRCASKADSLYTAIEVLSRKPQEWPPCVSMALAQPGGGMRGPADLVCPLDYAPGFLRFSVEPIVQRAAKLGFPGASDSTLQHAQILVNAYEPLDHLSRRLTIPEFRLRDWLNLPAKKLP